MIKLDFYPFEYNSPERNMEIDRWFLISGSGFSFRLYGWEPCGVSIGVSQQREKVCNVEYCNNSGIPIVTRITGGGAVYHKNDITYMFSAPLSFFKEKTVLGVYREIAGILKMVFESIGLKCSFAGNVDRNVRKQGMIAGTPCFLLPSDYEILVEGKKIVGNALRIEKNRVLQHGSIAFDFDFDETAIVLNTSKENLLEKTISLKSLLPDLTIQDFQVKCIECLNKKGFDVKVAEKPLSFKGPFFCLK